MEAHYQRAGISGAYAAGVDAGKLLFEFGGYALGIGGVAKGGGRFASEQLKRFEGRGVESVRQHVTGIRWGEGIKHQGMPWEDYVGTKLPANARLPRNFKIFDYYDPATKMAISVKTLDTTSAAKVVRPRQVYYSIKGNIDAVAGFDTYKLSGKTINASMISKRELQLAVPVHISKFQWIEIDHAIEYGKSKGVNVVVTQVK